MVNARNKEEERIRLAAGELVCSFEPSSLGVRWIRWKGVEVLRGIAAPLRDVDWGTLQAEVEFEIETKPGSFAIEFRAVYSGEAEAVFVWIGKIRGGNDGALSYDLEGYALRSIESNRAGFCVLHPSSCSGQACDVEYTDGTIESANFPEAISPHQPFFNIRSIRHEPGPGLRVCVRMEGDVFEMEDQRNWTDASFKTYCRPLSEPKPYRITPEQPIRQSVELSVEETAGGRFEEQGKERRVAEQWFAASLPRLGARWIKGVSEIMIRESSIVPRHILFELDSDRSDSLDELDEAIEMALRLGSVLLLQWTVRADLAEGQVGDLRDKLSCLGTQLEVLLIDAETGSTPPACLEMLSQLTDFKLGSGTRGYFAEFNRQRPVCAGARFASFVLSPQVHAFDDESLLETVAMQSVVLKNARAIAGDAPLHVGPITFIPRPRSDRADIRQGEALGGLWFLGSVASLMEGGASSATYWALQGEGGFLSDGCRLSPAGEVFRALLGGYSGKAFYLNDKSESGRAFGVALVGVRSASLAVANFSDTPREVSWDVGWGQFLEARVIAGDPPSLKGASRVEMGGRSALVIGLKA